MRYRMKTLFSKFNDLTLKTGVKVKKKFKVRKITGVDKQWQILKTKKCKKGVFGKNAIFGGSLAPSLDGNVKILLKKVQCRYPGYLLVKFYNKLTDSSPDQSAHGFSDFFGPWDDP